MQNIIQNNKILFVSGVIVLVGCCVAGIATLFGGTDSIVLPGFLAAVFN